MSLAPRFNAGSEVVFWFRRVATIETKRKFDRRFATKATG
jgi:hypothetical protein